eukprot:m.94865 g.94865  ORF g.94865 m.94865 type:complete len:97 (-) comp8933_c1_seq1:68-358(-)
MMHIPINVVSPCLCFYTLPFISPARHSQNNWCEMDYDEYPNYLKVKATSVVLKAGEVLYLPSYWFHYIMSIEPSIQCNTRSGKAIRGEYDITACGF